MVFSVKGGGVVFCMKSRCVESVTKPYTSCTPCTHSSRECEEGWEVFLSRKVHGWAQREHECVRE